MLKIVNLNFKIIIFILNFFLKNLLSSSFNLMELNLNLFEFLNYKNNNYFYFKINFFFYIKNIFDNIEKNNFFKFDIFFRFPKLSFKLSALFLNFFFFNKQNYQFFEINNWMIYFKLPTVAGIGNLYNSIYKRIAFLIIGDFDYLPLNYTYAGYFTPYIIRPKKLDFFLNITGFLFIPKYRFLFSKINNSFEKYKNYYIFFSQKPNINLSILFFITFKKKYNFFEISSFKKQYNIFSKKNTNYNFFNLNWLFSKKIKVTPQKRMTSINVQTKHKYLLKFHRNSFNNLYQWRLRTYRLTKFFLHISKQPGSFFQQYVNLDLSLKVFLLRVHFVYNLLDSEWLISNGYVFINGTVCYNQDYIVNTFDRIQLIINEEIYLYHRLLISNNITRYCRMWKTLKKYYLTLNKPYKTKPTTKRKWLIKSLWTMIDIPKYLEIDYTILTIFILYKPFTNIDVSPIFFLYWKYPIIRLYNWKYYY